MHQNVAIIVPIVGTNVAPFGVTLLLCGFATGCDTTHWCGCAHQSMSDAATFLARGIAAGGC